jgi:hypothetical protein
VSALSEDGELYAAASHGPSGDQPANRVFRPELDAQLHPLDGQVHDVPWGEHFFELEPGQHEVQVSYRYLRVSRAGKASIVVDVPENQVVQVSYRAPRSVLVAFRAGRLEAQPV